MQVLTITPRFGQRSVSMLVASVMSLFGMTGFASADSISNTGYNSDNSISSSYNSNTTVSNTNNVAICNTNHQSAYSGDVTSSDNTTAGSAASGLAANANDTASGVSITN